MRLIVLSHVPIKGKDGRKWDKVYALTEKGKIVEPFMDNAQYGVLGFTEDDFLSPSDIKEIFEKYQAVDISFDDQGRIESYKK